MATAAIRRWWGSLAGTGCIVRLDGADDYLLRCRSPAEIAHCHGASIVLRMQEPKAKGKKLARYDWLVLPICPWHHRLTATSLDADPEAWEAKYGQQAQYLDELAALHGIDLWALARAETARRYRRPTKILPRRLSVSV